METRTGIRFLRPLMWVWVVIGLLVVGCDQSTYEQWDDDDSQSLSEQEFVEGFNATGHFAKWDVERDGSLTESEFFAGSFGLLDKSNDGNLGNEEWSKFADHFRGQMDTNMSAADQDGDGQINKSEYTQHMSKSEFYPRWDVNQDNRLDPVEFAEGIFIAWDVNDDTQLTEAEYVAWQDNIETWESVNMENLLPSVDEEEEKQPSPK